MTSSSPPRPTERRPAARGRVLAVAAVALAFGLGCGTGVLLAARGSARPEPTTETAGTCPVVAHGAQSVRGSVDQIAVQHAGAHRRVTVTGSTTLPPGTTDGLGGLLVRNVPPGAYRVVIAHDPTSPHAVTVVGPEDRPDPTLYESQPIAIDHLGRHAVDGYITTRDCTRLSYVIALPHTRPADGRYPVVVSYSGYSAGVRGNSREFSFDRQMFRTFTDAGYAVVGVNMRGTGCSGGAFDLMERLTWLDGYDVVETLHAQPWVGRIALVDKSWPGLSQLFVASTRPPHLAAIVPGAAVADFYRDVMYPGGIQNTGFGTTWAAGRDADNRYPPGNGNVRAITQGADPADPTCRDNLALRGQNVPTERSFDAHPTDDAYWHARRADVARIDVPTLLTVSWQDEQVSSRVAESMRDFRPGLDVRLVGTNGDHDAYYSGRPWALEREFLCVHLQPRCPAGTVRAYHARGPVTVLLESDEQGRPRLEFSRASLPTGDEGTRYRLGPTLVPDRPARAGGTSTFVDRPVGSFWFALRQDQATFTTAPLPSDVVMVGSGSADLWVSVPAPHTDVDLQVTLSDVRPDGNEMLVQSGWLRASGRALDPAASTPLRPYHPFTAPVPLRAGTLTEVRVEIGPFAHAFRAGSRLRLSVAGPGGATDAYPWQFGALPGGFPVTIAHDTAHPSSVMLPAVALPPSARLPRSWPSCARTAMQPCRRIFTVDRYSDAPDARPGDGHCATRDGGCTVRAAVEEAGAGSGGVTIRLPRGRYPLAKPIDVRGQVYFSGSDAVLTVRSGHVFRIRPDAGVIATGTGITNGRTTLDPSGGLSATRCGALCEFER